MDKPDPLIVVARPRVNQCQKPTGWLGRIVLRNMNSRHARVTDWGLAQIRIGRSDTILDVGCGGGRTVSKLAAVATEGRVYGVDYSRESVRISARTNQRAIDKGQVEIIEAPVSQLPFPANMFDLITAVETHFWWPDLAGDLREVFRVLKPGGRLVVIAEIYKGANTMTAKLAEKHLQSSGMAFLSVDEHRELLAGAGFSQVHINTQLDKGWICCIADKS